ncbi:hypothetical protein CsSME_00048460 [Camellia sinensis var. sinensis]
MATTGEEMASNAGSGKSFARRDRLLEIEAQVQKWWEEREVFRADSLEMPPKLGEKFFGNFPFPYMNGYLHLGHAFSFSKLEFAAAYHRLRGANVLLPFAFHCTGMPIKASADKLCREIQKFGNPPVFPTVEEEKSIDPEPQPEEANQVAPDIFKGKKSKAAAKSGGNMYQWEIMQSYGLSDDEITKFQDPYFWLTYFPPLAVEDLKAFGLGCDWRRTFITTDINPFFDSIVSMRKLLQKQVSGSKKAKVVNVPSHQNKPMVGLIFVNEQYDGWKKECLNILGSKFNSATCSFAPDQEIIEALQKSAIGQEANFKQIQKLCMPFLRFKKDEVIAVGVQALDLKLPFGEKDVLEENSELVKLQLGLERLEILSVADPDAVKKAGSHVSLLSQNPPSPGNPTAIFLSE